MNKEEAIENFNNLAKKEKILIERGMNKKIGTDNSLIREELRILWEKKRDLWNIICPQKKS